MGCNPELPEGVGARFPGCYRALNDPNDPNGAPRYLPVHPQSKKPLMRDWPNEASSSIADVRRWWRRGYRLGLQLDGTFAIDLDPAQAYFGFQLDFGLLPQTWWQETPRGGRHYLFSVAGSAPSFDLAIGGTREPNAFSSRSRWRAFPRGQCGY